jgi:hypothetical protein
LFILEAFLNVSSTQHSEAEPASSQAPGADPVPPKSPRSSRVKAAAKRAAQARRLTTDDDIDDDRRLPTEVGFVGSQPHYNLRPATPPAEDSAGEVVIYLFITFNYFNPSFSGLGRR